MNAPPSNSARSQALSHARWQARWQRYSAAGLRGYHAYATWLVGISWKRFIVLSLLTLILVGIVHDSPPFTWSVTEQVQSRPRRVVVLPPRAPAVPRAAELPTAPLRPPTAPATTGGAAERGDGVQINIGKDGIRIISPLGAKPAEAASAAAATADRAADAAASAADGGIQINLPAGPTSDAVREAVREARRQIEESVREARQVAEEAARDAADARRDAEATIAGLAAEIDDGEAPARTRTRRVGVGDLLLQLTLLWIVASAIVKTTYKGRMQAEVKAAQATETAEAESLKRQVIEARMAAMQAQIEPHFLFNTLASIDHLIETDPPRASTMQKNLIALLRASMPTMREASGSEGGGGVRDLGRELAVIRPYLEILKVRMEERLATEIVVPEGLLSAQFPPMMVQTLVENAIKHGLEPKAEGGTLRLVAEIVHGNLQVTVADTGLGFGKAATAGTGVGLANIRERLQLLYGPKARLTVAENKPGGTLVTITVPYRTVEGSGA